MRLGFYLSIFVFSLTLLTTAPMPRSWANDDENAERCRRLFPEIRYSVNRRLTSNFREELRWLVSFIRHEYDGCAIERVSIEAKADEARAEIQLYNGFRWIGWPERVRRNWSTVQFNLRNEFDPIYQENLSVEAKWSTIQVRSIRLLLMDR